MVGSLFAQADMCLCPNCSWITRHSEVGQPQIPDAGTRRVGNGIWGFRRLTAKLLRYWQIPSPVVLPTAVRMPLLL